MFEAKAEMLRPTIGRKFALLFAALILLGLANQWIVRAALDQFSKRVAIVDASSSLRRVGRSAQIELLELDSGIDTGTAEVDYQLGRFDRTLNALENGGRIAGQRLPKLPAELQPEWLSLRDQWRAYRDEVGSMEGRLKTGGNIRTAMLTLDADDRRLVSSTQRFVADLTAHYRRIDRSTIVGIYWLGVVDLLLILASFLAIRAHIVLPLRKLAAASRAISAGDYGARSGYRSRDEIGQLAAAFDDMAGATESHVKQIETDILEIRRTESALKEQRDLLQQFMDSSPLGIVIVDSELRYLAANPAIAAINGLPAEAHIGRTIKQVLPQLAPALEPLFRRVLDSGETIRDLEVCGESPRHPGERRCWLVSHFPIFCTSGKVRAVGVMVLDITERIETGRRLALMTRLYSLLSRANQAIAHIRDIDALFAEICRIAVHDGTFVMAWAGRLEGERLLPFAHWGRNEGYLEQLGIVVTDPVRGSGPSSVAIREQRPVICNDIATDPMMAHWREAALARGYRSSAVFPLAQGGEIFGAFTLYAESPQVFSPEVLSLLQGLSWDLSFALDAFREAEMRRMAEANLRRLNEELEWRVAERTQQLEAVNRELESFSYSVSHDLRAPLRAIDGFSQIVQQRYAGQLDEAGRGYLDRVRRASQRMGELIDDLLKLARISRGELRRQDVDLSGIAQAVIEDLRRAEPEREIDCQIQEGLSAYGDPGLLRVVLDNLIGNAWKFTRRSKDPNIEVGKIDHDGEMVYFVRDNGAGFDAAYADKLFQAFQRLHQESEFEGTGIGLATVQRVIRRHKGLIWAKGEPGQGASFYFTLPQRQGVRT